MAKRKPPSFLPPLLTATTLGAVGYGALCLARLVWQRNVDYVSPYTAPLPPTQPAPAALAKRAILIVFDGLRCDTAMTMPMLMALREQGVALVARVGQPSLSLPGWTAMMTGAWQEISGVNSNFYTGAPPIESIFSLAQQQGLTTAIVGDRVWQQLFGPHASYGKYVQWQKALGAGRIIAEGYIPGPISYHDKAGIIGSDEQLLAAALDLWQNQRPDFMLLHLSAADNFGHGYGAASEQYRSTARDHLDPALGQLLNAVELSDTAVLVTSDHGHLDAGGHGGWEEIVLDSPLIMAGAGIKPDEQGMGYYGRQAQVDIAPTLSALLGLPITAHNQGRPLTEHLALDERGQAAIDLAWLQQQSEFYRMYGERSGAPTPLVSGVSIERLQDDFKLGEYAEVSKATHQAVRTLHAEARAWRSERLALERARRLLVIAAASLPALALTLWQTASANPPSKGQGNNPSPKGGGWEGGRVATRTHPRPLPLGGAILPSPKGGGWVGERTTPFTIHHSPFTIIAAALLANLAYRALYAARGYRLSLSTFRTDDRLEQFYRERVADAAASGLVSAAALGLLRRKASPAALAAAVSAASCWSLLIVGGQLAWFYYLWGIEYKWHLPDYRYAFKFYLDIVQFGGYALAALPGVGLALMLRWLANHQED